MLCLFFSFYFTVALNQKPTSKIEEGYFYEICKKGICHVPTTACLFLWTPSQINSVSMNKTFRRLIINNKEKAQ